MQEIRKKVLLLAALIIVAATGQAAEIQYHKGNWNELLRKAKAEHKYIFVDAYTDWCSWCKVMDKKTMTDTGIINFMNRNFIAAKIDMEHGEGIQMAMKYHVTGYPTFLFFNPEGQFVFLTQGYFEPSAFKQQLADAITPAKQFKAPGFGPVLNLPFPAFYVNAYAENGKRAFPTSDTVFAFLDQQTDLFNEVSWGVMSRFPLNPKYTSLFLKNINLAYWQRACK
ncbi:MAG: DUF255 domain-containing protein [Chitinophagia bacterium]|nr:DUF255 domain-containing protein [Chitinophagia bacterium]